MRLDEVRPLFDASGPFITVHLEVGQATEDARQQLDARWTSTRHQLEREEVAPDLLARLEEALREPTNLPGPARRTIVAVGDEIRFDDVRSGSTTWPETVGVGPLPDLAGWVSMADGQFPFALVRADRAGADLELYHAQNTGRAADSSVEGSTLHLTKVPEGDWAQDKYQQRSENQWEANARLVADAVEDLGRQERLRAVIVCGDVRARTDVAGLLRERLPQATVIEVDSGGRAAGTSEEALWADVRRELAALQGRDIDDVVQQIQRGVAVGEGVVHGVDRVADALLRGEVERLVLDLEAAHAVTVAPRDHRGLPLPATATQAAELPADQALIAAAALTSAELSLLPGEVELPTETALSGGVAAVLRWDDRPPDQTDQS